MKASDEAYYDRWYRHPRHRVSKEPDRERKVHLAVSVAEYVIGRVIRSVLDIGCGEGLWYLILRRLRPDIRYIGVDPSEYAVTRYGASRHIRRGSFGSFDRLRLPSAFDLVVCARSEEHTSELQSPCNLVCRLLLEKKKKKFYFFLFYKNKIKINSYTKV